MGADNQEDGDLGSGQADFDAIMDSIEAGGVDNSAPVMGGNATTAASQQREFNDEPEPEDDGEVVVDEDGNVFVSGDDEDEPDQQAAGNTGDRAYNMRREYERKLDKTRDQFQAQIGQTQADLAETRQQLAQALGYLQALSQGNRKEDADPFAGLDPNDPHDRIAINAIKAEKAAARAESLVRKQEESEQKRIGELEAGRTLQIAQSTLNNLTEHHSDRLGIQSGFARHQAWNAGFVAMQKGATTQGVSQAIRQSLAGFRQKAAPTRTPATAANLQTRTGGAVQPNAARTATRKDFAKMSKGDFDSEIDAFLQNILP